MIGSAGGRASVGVAVTGYSCACPEPTASTRPAVILDPFGGTGTTAGVAHALGRHGISVDLSADYLRLARWRIEESGLVDKVRERTYGKSKVKRPRKPKVAVDEGQSLFDMLGMAAG